jgi:hypothetical protein
MNTEAHALGLNNKTCFHPLPLTILDFCSR